MICLKYYENFNKTLNLLKKSQLKTMNFLAKTSKSFFIYRIIFRKVIF